MTYLLLQQINCNICKKKKIKNVKNQYFLV